MKSAPGPPTRAEPVNDDNTIEAWIERDAMTLEQSLAEGARIALLHQDASPSFEGTDYRALVDRNFEMLLPLIENLIPARERLALQRFAAAFLLGWASVLEARAKAGNVIEGHGDVADQLGTLLMELLERTDSSEAGDALLIGYHDAGGRDQPEALMAFFGSFRSQVHALEALSAAGSETDPRKQKARAQRLLNLSGRLGWRARGPMLLLITGPSVTGKTTLARALGRTSGLTVLTPDADEAQPGDRSVDTQEAYAELARRAGHERAAIIDASFGDARLQQAFTEQLVDSSHTHPLAVECHAPADLRAARAFARRRGEPDSSGSPSADRPAKAFDGLKGLAGDAHLAVDTRAPVSMQVDEVASWLDSLMAAGRSE